MDGIITAAVAIAALIFGLKWGDKVERARLLLIYILVALLLLCIFSAAGSAVDKYLAYSGLPNLRGLVPVSGWEFFWGGVGFYVSAVLVSCMVVRYYIHVKGEPAGQRQANLKRLAAGGVFGPLFIFLAWLSFTVHNHVCPGGCGPI